MRITKLEHSGMIVDKNGKKLVFDPVEFESTLPELKDVVAVILTHGHSDHFQSECVEAIRALNPEMRIFGPEDLKDKIADLEVVHGGEEMRVEEFDLRFFGRDHAAVKAGSVPCMNIGVTVDGKLTNPGDSFDLLDLNGETNALMVAEVAPWCKVAECMEFIRMARPKYVIPVHDAILSPMGKGVYDFWLKSAAEEVGAEFAGLAIGESIDV